MLAWWLVIARIPLLLALLGAAAVFGTDVFFCVVGRTALRGVSDAAIVETMGQLHEVADRRMPIFGVLGIVGACERRLCASLVPLGGERGLRAAGLGRRPSHRRRTGERRGDPPCARGLRAFRRASAANALGQRHRRAGAPDRLRGPGARGSARALRGVRRPVEHDDGAAAKLLERDRPFGLRRSSTAPPRRNAPRSR